MPIRECSVTLSSNLFLSELYNNRSSVNTKLVNSTDSILVDNTFRSNGFGIDQTYDTSEFDGLWKFWNRLHRTEKSATFNYTPMFNDITQRKSGDEFPLALSKQILSKYPIDDSKVSCRLVYYPFGLFVVRIRVYLRFSKSVPADQLVSIINELPKQINQYRKPNRNWAFMLYRQSVFRHIFEQILLEIFSTGRSRDRNDVPDKYWGRLGSLKRYPIIYMYDGHLSDTELAKLIKLDQRELSESYIASVSDPSFGHLKNDSIVVHRQGAVLQTPYFSNISSRNRRWKRIQLLNNAYLSVELANFERDFGYEYIEILQSILDKLNSGTITGVPIKPKYLVMMRESLLIGSRLRGVRNRMYDEIGVDSTQNHITQVDEYTGRIIDHSSMVRSGLKKLAPGLFSAVL